MRRLWQAANISTERLTSVPLFGPQVGERFSFYQMESAFDLMMHCGAGVPLPQLQDYSIHSLRIWLACALLALDVPRPDIKRMLRWRGDDSLEIYARINTSVWRARVTATYDVRVSSAVASRIGGLGAVDLAAYAARFAEA